MGMEIPRNSQRESCTGRDAQGCEACGGSAAAAASRAKNIPPGHRKPGQGAGKSSSIKPPGSALGERHDQPGDYQGGQRRNR